jgi:hypothetical protein
VRSAVADILRPARMQRAVSAEIACRFTYYGY